MMFAVNDTVMYGNAGVCEIVDIRAQKFYQQPEKLYYVLKPIYEHNETIYCPVDNEKVRMRRLLSKDEIYQLIQNMSDLDIAWIDDDQQRKEVFNEMLKNGSHQDLIRLIRALYLHKQQTEKAGQKFHVADTAILKEAQRILHGEFAHVLHLQPDEVAPFIMKALGEQV